MITKHALSLGLAAAFLAAASVPSSAAPVLSNTAAVKTASSDGVTEVRWRGGGAVAAGIGAGIALGAIAASRPYGYGYGYGYGPSYGDGGYYEPYYEPAPVYGYGYPYGYYPQSHRYYNGRYDTNAVGNW